MENKINENLGRAYKDSLVERGILVGNSIVPESYKMTKDVQDPFIKDVVDKYNWFNRFNSK